ncbi:alpha/beta hydrolase-fold protein [Tsukamurella sp. 8F]|uniref:alpha/beta hydrolase-fold protein n=1 Tax=unclassified Tsukamurella TaxID=2633480 RepID=UPI0023B94285|nr:MULTISPECIES: alpha/beta hydrolase-fold protein [unclassified Tsukamurella]MDF0530785.1 alpha/beta hydrolase-fold protein [Tsukamurella sp. 8J]MDF0588311.1 alpha/beta hydrolase-fold protein [Tsukamurella sp. 8F]
MVERASRRVTGLAGAAMAAVVLAAAGTAAPVISPQLTASAKAAPQAPGPQVPSGVRIVGAQWQSDRQVDVTVHSAVMNADVKVQLLLARDWYARPKAAFPTLYLLDGLRARDDRNGWLINTNVADFYRDKNVTVVLPVGGQSSWYTNWKQPDNGKNYQWETFLTSELPPVLQRDWRATTVRGVAGVSMGGSAAYMLAGRHPRFYRFAGSYSGILSMSSTGMPTAIATAMRDAGNYDANKMFGPESSPEWAAHDPLKLADKLRGTSLYFSSGNGESPTNAQPDLSGTALEILSRASNQAFAVQLNKLGIPAQAIYRPSGIHSWPYWQFEDAQAWPQAQAALGVGNPAACKPGGAIGVAALQSKSLGACITPEYAVKGGRAQDFRGGQVFWSQATGAHIVGGAIAGEYARQGGPAGTLGYPTSDELASPDKKGRYQKFQGGTVYWTAATGAHSVGGAIFAKWGSQGYERGKLGYPVTSETKLAGGGAFTRFTGGSIYWSPKTAATVVPNGPVFDAWGKAGYEGGRLGYPVLDPLPVPGGVLMRFQHGTISSVNGKTSVQ